MQESIFLRKLELKNGGRFDYWVSNREIIGKFIKEHGLKAVPREHLIIDDPVSLNPQAVERESRLLVRPFPGGLRIPHLHFQGEVYPLESKDWAEFSKMALGAAKKRIEAARTVSFEQVMEIAESVETLI